MPPPSLEADDGTLLELVQRTTLGYFRDFARSVSGLARDRTRHDEGPGNDLVAAVAAREATRRN